MTRKCTTSSRSDASRVQALRPHSKYNKDVALVVALELFHQEDLAFTTYWLCWKQMYTCVTRRGLTVRQGIKPSPPDIFKPTTTLMAPRAHSARFQQLLASQQSSLQESIVDKHKRNDTFTLAAAETAPRCQLHTGQR
jgi:hypothetical protein